MSSYDEMTKDELLDEARARGISPANASMSKGELQEALEADDAGDAPEQLVTTTMTKDFLSVPLINATPGTSQATDRLGRSVIAGNKDYIGRNLVA